MKNQTKLTEHFLEMTTVTCLNVSCSIQFDFIVTSHSLQEITELRLISSKPWSCLDYVQFTCMTLTFLLSVESEMESKCR